MGRNPTLNKIFFAFLASVWVLCLGIIPKPIIPRMHSSQSWKLGKYGELSEALIIHKEMVSDLVSTY